MEKTNVMRILDQKKIKYNAYEYPHNGEALEGTIIAELLGQNPSCVFKTLVAKGKNVYVFMVPVNKSLDLKKASKAVSEKKLEMIHVKDLLETTGYMRGSVSPIGMKKSFITVCDKSALDFKTIICSAGKLGYQVELSPLDLSKLCRLSFEEIVE